MSFHPMYVRNDLEPWYRKVHRPCSDLSISKKWRIQGAFRRLHCKTILDVLLKWNDFQYLKNFGTKSIRQLDDALVNFGV